MKRAIQFAFVVLGLAALFAEYTFLGEKLAEVIRTSSEPNGVKFMLVFWAAIQSLLLFGLCHSITGDLDRKAESRRKQLEKERKEKEKADYIAALSPLDTTYLLPMPEYFAKSYGEVRKPGVFSRYNRLVIFDWQGRGYVALATSEVMHSLRLSEIPMMSMFVPFGGPGEMYSVTPMQMDGMKIDIYPLWLAGMPPTSDDWQKWLKIEKNFERARSSENYQKVIGAYWETEKYFVSKELMRY